MKTIVLAAIATLPFSVLAQSNGSFAPFPDNGIYLSATDFATHKLTDGFDKGQPGYSIREETFQRALKIDQPNAPEEKLLLTNLWGERKEGVDYRSFDGDLYRVEHADKIFIYSKPTSVWITGSGGFYPATQYYFSRKADSPIHLITSDNLKDIYYDQPDKNAAFESLDGLSNKPGTQAQHLLKLFYPTSHATSQSAS